MAIATKDLEELLPTELHSLDDPQRDIPRIAKNSETHGKD